MNEQQKLQLCQWLVQNHFLPPVRLKRALELCKNTALANAEELIAFLAQQGNNGSAGLVAGHQQVWHAYQQAIRGAHLTQIDGASPHNGPVQNHERRVGKYHLLKKKLGEGAMGVVYLATNTSVDRQEVVKMIKQQLDPQNPADMETLERFRREAKAMAGIRHPNVVTIFQVEVWDNKPALVMEFIDGSDLKDSVPAEDRTVQQVMILFKGICRGVSAVHQSNKIHRDLKPANIMVRSTGEPVVMDLGLVNYLRSQSSSVSMTLSQEDISSLQLTQDGFVVGTPMYMAPEQMAGEILTPAADVYALAKILYYMLVKDYLHRFEWDHQLSPDENMQVFADAVQSEQLPDGFYEAMRRQQIPQAIQYIMERCLARDPSARYQNASEMLVDVDGYFESLEKARKDEEQNVLRERAQRKWLITVAAAGMIATVLMLFVALGLAWARSEARARANVEIKLRQEAQALGVAQTKRAEAEKRVQQELSARLEEKEKHDRVVKHETAARMFIEHCEWQKAKTELDAAISFDEHYYPARVMRAQVLFSLWDMACEKDRLWLMENGPKEHVSEHGFYAIFHTENLLPVGEIRDYSEVLEQITDPHYRGLVRAYLLANKAIAMKKSRFFAHAERKNGEALAILDGLKADWLTRLIQGYVLVQSEDVAGQHKALRLLGHSWAENPDSPMSFYWHGQMLRHLANEESLLAKKADRSFHNQLARIYHEQAVEDFRRMSLLIPLSPAAHVNLADSLVEMALAAKDPKSDLDLVNQGLQILSKLRLRKDKVAKSQSVDTELAYGKTLVVKCDMHIKRGEQDEAEDARQQGLETLRKLEQQPNLNKKQRQQTEYYLKLLGM